MKRRWHDPRDPTVRRERGSEGGSLPTEFERGGVDAVPQPGRPWPVIEHVPQVGTTVGTFDLRAAHEQAPILLLANVSFLNGRPETRPAGPRVELGPRCEEFGPADDAKIHARVVVVPIFSGEGSFRPLVYDDVVLKRRELLLQLRLVELLHGPGRTLRRLKVSARSRRRRSRWRSEVSQTTSAACSDSAATRPAGCPTDPRTRRTSPGPLLRPSAR